MYANAPLPRSRLLCMDFPASTMAIFSLTTSSSLDSRIRIEQSFVHIELRPTVDISNESNNGV